MRQSKFTETQIVSILKEADAGRPLNFGSSFLIRLIMGSLERGCDG
jgi:hypothetical protein